MNRTTVITESDYTISMPRDDAVEGFDCERNKKISYLPVKIHEKFPNLVVLYADYCNIKAISKANFEKLGKLKRLSLSFNQIVTVNSNTFDDLTALELLWMREFEV